MDLVPRSICNPVQSQKDMKTQLPGVPKDQAVGVGSASEWGRDSQGVTQAKAVTLDKAQAVERPGLDYQQC